MWFAVYTKSHHEKSVARQLAQKGIEHYLPLHKAKHTWTHRRRVTLDLPLFPNYLFVHSSQSERSRVLATEGVVMFVDRGDVITPVPDVEIEQLRAELHLRASEPHPGLSIGEKGRIVAGPLAGMEGIVLRQKGDLRLILTVPLIDRCVAVEVNADEVATCADSPVGFQTGIPNQAREHADRQEKQGDAAFRSCNSCAKLLPS